MSAAPLITHDYTIAASQSRVWNLLANSILQSMPIEQTEVVDNSTMRGVLKYKLGPLTIPLKLKIEVTDIVPMSVFTTLVTAAFGGIETDLNVTYTLKSLDDDETGITCTATIARAPAWMALTRPMQRTFAADMFKNIQNELVRAC